MSPIAGFGLLKAVWTGQLKAVISLRWCCAVCGHTEDVFSPNYTESAVQA